MGPNLYANSNGNSEIGAASTGGGRREVAAAAAAGSVSSPKLNTGDEFQLVNM